MKIRVKTGVLGMCMALLLSACSNVSYIDRHSYAFRDDSNNSRAKPLAEKRKGLQEFGAIHFADPKDPEGKGRTFVLKRDKSYLAAETTLADHTGESKSWFDRSYFSFGADRKKNLIGFQLRFVY